MGIGDFFKNIPGVGDRRRDDDRDYRDRNEDDDRRYRNRDEDEDDDREYRYRSRVEEEREYRDRYDEEDEDDNDRKYRRRDRDDDDDDRAEGSVTPPIGQFGGQGRARTMEPERGQYGYDDPRGYDGGYDQGHEEKTLRRKAGWKIWR